MVVVVDVEAEAVEAQGNDTHPVEGLIQGSASLENAESSNSCPHAWPGRNPRMSAIAAWASQPQRMMKAHQIPQCG